MARQKNWFPIVGMDRRDDAEHTVGFDPGLTDEQRKILITAFHDTAQEEFQQIFEGIVDDLRRTSEATVPKTEVQPKYLDTTPAAERLLQDYKENLRRIRGEITDVNGDSFACFPFQFDWENPACRGTCERNPNSPVCVLCRELHGYDPERINDKEGGQHVQSTR